MVETRYDISDKFGIKIAILADIHNRKIEELLHSIKKNMPDIILIPGDFVDGAEIARSQNHNKHLIEAIQLLNQISSIAPTYVSLGNHEKQLSSEEILQLKKSNAEILQEEYKDISEHLFIGGLSSGRNYHDKNASQNPSTKFLDSFEELKGYKMLLSHHPEYYEVYLMNRDIDLIVSGHAHGGQIRFFDCGLYAPGQGLFPKYTSGVYDKKLIISRGIAGTEIWPRINNKPEIVYITI